MTSAAISAQNNFQGLILGGYIYQYTPPRRYAPGLDASQLLPQNYQRYRDCCNNCSSIHVHSKKFSTYFFRMSLILFSCTTALHQAILIFLSFAICLAIQKILFYFDSQNISLRLFSFANDIVFYTPYASSVSLLTFLSASFRFLNLYGLNDLILPPCFFMPRWCFSTCSRPFHHYIGKRTRLVISTVLSKLRTSRDHLKQSRAL